MSDDSSQASPLAYLAAVLMKELREWGLAAPFYHLNQAVQWAEVAGKWHDHQSSIFETERLEKFTFVFMP